jgi:hypothetical protein
MALDQIADLAVKRAPRARVPGSAPAGPAACPVIVDNFV